jgi:UDP-N-acetylglucosamine 2-epimerase (non-hydrolysing)
MNMMTIGEIDSHASALVRPVAAKPLRQGGGADRIALRKGSRSSRLKVMTVFGTRPEGIKMMPVLQELRRRQSMDLRVCVTGQHRAMVDQVFTAFGERPDIDLDIMAPNQTLSDITARVLSRLNEVLIEEKPDLVLVHGDTTTAFAAAMAAFYARIPIGHVEAGLRSHDMQRPWPEEFNRVAIDAVAALMFAPTEAAAANLAREYNQRGEVFVTGNTGIDALLQMASRIDNDTAYCAELRAKLPILDDNRRLILVTGHRRESFGDGFEAICDGLATVAARGDVQIVYPVHLNPQVQGVVRRRLSESRNIHLIQPLDYASMVYLMRVASVLITDSGGIQEEGPALGKPVLVMRDVTERPEAVACGAARLIGTDPQIMRQQVDALLDDPAEYAVRSRAMFPYGDGTAAMKIGDLIEEVVA